MANDAIPTTATLGGKEYALNFTMGAIRTAREQYGASLPLLALDELAVDVIWRLGWIALLGGGATISEDEAVELFVDDDDGAGDVFTHALGRLSRYSAALRKMGERQGATAKG